ncbi:MAG: hypothetical protein NZ750_12265 [Anaerolineae bacterium]|nr:hypothetical protein [Anaerolineae bacterium]MDW8172111.1 hypothetical protein [Anaerolineae bacterium]
MPDLFIEVFPLELAGLPPLNAFLLNSARPDPISAGEGSKIARRLERALGGGWTWVEGRLLTDVDCSPVQVDIALDVLRTQEAALLEGVLGVQEDRAWASSPQTQALYAERLLLTPLETQLRAALSKHVVPLGQARVERQVEVQPCVVAGQPALAMSIKSWVIAPQSLDQLMKGLDDPRVVVGWTACDKSNLEAQGRIVGLGAMMASERERLLSLTRRAAMRQLIEAAADDERVVRLELRGQAYEYAASALWRVLTPNDSTEDLARWQVSPQQISRALRLRPDARAQLVRAASDVLKAHKLIGSAYNSRTHPHLFINLDYMPEFEYGEKRVRPYDLATMASDFQRHKVYARHPRYESAPITLAVINALDDRAADFVEALRRLLEKQFGFSINLLKERRVKVFTEKNVESAVRVLEKEAPDVLLAIFPDSNAADDDLDSQARALKAQCLARGMALHILYESVLDDADATPLVAMSLLAKTGSAPYVLAEGLDYADLVVGLGVVRERLTRKDRLSLLNRVYRSDGLFLGYHFESVELAPDDVIPPDVIPRLFPQETFGQRAVILHHDGEIARDVLRALGQWAKQIGFSMGAVEVYRWGAPRLYALEKGVVAPPWGSTFRVSDEEAYVVASSPVSGTPQPLRVRVVGRSLPIEQAVYSVLAWSLLHYGAQGVNKLPVTLSAADDMASWLGRGLHLPRSGDVPFWL